MTGEMTFWSHLKYLPGSTRGKEVMLPPALIMGLHSQGRVHLIRLLRAEILKSGLLSGLHQRARLSQGLGL